MRTLLLACLLIAVPGLSRAQDPALARFELTGALPADAARLGYWKTLATRCDLGGRKRRETLFAIETMSLALRDMSPSSIDEGMVKSLAAEGMQQAERDVAGGVDDNPLCDRLVDGVAAAAEAVLALRH